MRFLLCYVPKIPLERLKFAFILQVCLLLLLGSSVNYSSSTEEVPSSNSCHTGLWLNLLDVNCLLPISEHLPA